MKIYVATNNIKGAKRHIGIAKTMKAMRLAGQRERAE